MTEPLTDFLGIFLATALLNNLALVQLLGVSGLFAFSNGRDQSREVALASFLLITVSSIINGLLDRFLLGPLDLQTLRPILFISVCAILATLLSELIRKYFPLSHRRDHLAFLLSGINSAVLGTALINSSANTASIMQLIAYSIGSATGFSVLILAFAALRLRINEQAQPVAFRGAAIQLISAGLVAMSLLGLAGIA